MNNSNVECIKGQGYCILNDTHDAQPMCKCLKDYSGSKCEIMSTSLLVIKVPDQLAQSREQGKVLVELTKLREGALKRIYREFLQWQAKPMVYCSSWVSVPFGE